jgi:hypothetical protein
MPRIKTEQLIEGMVVSTDVMNLDNMLLIPAGAALSERQINILQAWGVAEVEVKASESVPDTDPLAKLSPEELEKMTREVKGRFWQPVEADPVFTEIFRLVLQRHARKGGI